MCGQKYCLQDITLFIKTLQTSEELGITQINFILFSAFQYY